MKMPESLKNSVNNVKKTLKNSALVLALVSALSSCGADPSTMSFEKNTQSGKMSIVYAGREGKDFDIEIRKLGD